MLENEARPRFKEPGERGLVDKMAVGEPAKVEAGRPRGLEGIGMLRSAGSFVIARIEQKEKAAKLHQRQHKRIVHASCPPRRLSRSSLIAIANVQ